MKRDICCTYQRNLPEVYNAYLQAARQVFGKDAAPQNYHTLTIGLNFSVKYNMNGGACTVHFMPIDSGTAVNVRYSIAQLVGARYAAHCRDLTRGVESILQCTSMPTNIQVDLFLLPQNQVTSLDDPRCRVVAPMAATAIPQAAPVMNEPVVVNEPVMSVPITSEPITGAPVMSAPVMSVPIKGTPVMSIPLKDTPVGNTPTGNTPGVPLQRDFKFCTACGTKLPADARFCTSCGRKQ